MERLHGLDALRGIAAIGILAMHCDGQFELGLGLGKLALGVDLFFMLSGYVMARTYETRLADGTLSLRRFMAIRYRRLWATLAIGTVIGVPVAVLRYPLDFDFFAALALSLAMMPAIGTAMPLFAFNGPAWSLFFEIFGNALHALALARLRTSFVIVAVIACVVALAVYHPLAGAWPRGTLRMEFAATFLRFFGAYLLGIALYRLCRDRVPLAIPAWPMLGLALVAAVFLPALLCVYLAFPAMIVAALGIRAGRWADLSGQVSYPLYATHLPVLELVRVAGGGIWLAVGVALALTAFLVAMLERPRRGRAKVPAL